MAITQKDITRVKAEGFLLNRGTENFSGRVITGNGKISADDMIVISEAAKLYGNGEMAFTSRLTVEVQAIPYENIEPFKAYIARNGLYTGGTGKKVRPVVSCKGTTCVFGLIDTFKISREIHERFFEGMNASLALPHKFKIAVGGCPNNCMKPDLNDLGIIGQRIVMIDESICKKCKRCMVEEKCPIKVPVRDESGKVYIDMGKCNHCGRCITNCPFKAAIEEKTAYKVTLGGRWGKKYNIGRPLSVLIESEEELYKIVEKAILLFREQGIDGERFSDTINRIGFEEAEKIILSDDILSRKEAILSV